MKSMRIFLALGILMCLFVGSIAGAAPPVKHSAAWYKAHSTKKHSAAWYKAHAPKNHSAAWYKSHAPAKHSAAWYKTHKK